MESHTSYIIMFQRKIGFSFQVYPKDSYQDATVSTLSILLPTYPTPSPLSPPSPPSPLSYPPGAYTPSSYSHKLIYFISFNSKLLNQVGIIIITTSIIIIITSIILIIITSIYINHHHHYHFHYHHQ